MMLRILFLSFALIFEANCTSTYILRTKNHENVNQNARLTLQNATPASVDDRRNVSKGSEKKKEVPPAFREIDFKNFSYPISLKNRTVRLKDGKLEYYKDKDLGNGWFDFEDVDYVDLAGDGNKAAVVQLFWLACGASCDGGSHLFYFYSIKRGKLNLLQRIETGSLGYECGLKSFVLKKQVIALEAFRACRFNGVSLRSAYDADQKGGKFMATEFTRFVFRFNGRNFALKKKEVFPNPEEDVMNYPARVSIEND